MEAQDAAKAFHEQLAAILAASKASDPPDRLKQLCADGMLALLQLKAAHRSLAERTESFRQDAMDAKTQDGQSSLQLHNIEYEAAQHGKEVKSCKAFTSAYADTDLAMPSAADDEMADADATPHQLELQRLTKELKQRQQLQAQEAALKNTRSSVGDDLESQRAALRRLGQQLNALGSAGKQLASSLEGLEGGASQGLLGGVASVAATAPLLPVPLYVLYSQAIAAKSAHSLDMMVHVDGEVPEGGTNDALVAADADMLLHQGTTLLEVSFAYLPSLRVVTAAPSNPTHVQVLAALYPGDSGAQCPNPAHASMAWDATRPDRPYRWVQLVAGLDVLPPPPTASTATMEAALSTYRSQQRMAHVLERLRSRALAAAALTEQLTSLRKASLPLNPSSFRNTTKLVKFEESTSSSRGRRSVARDDAMALPAPGDDAMAPESPPADASGMHDEDMDGMELDYMAAAIAHPGTVATAPAAASTTTAVGRADPVHVAAQRVFKATFRHTEVMEATLQVTVSDEYPDVLPCWRLVGVTSQGKSTSATTRKAASLPRAQLATAAAELATERVPADKRAHVLAFQTVALVRALDVYKALWYGDEAAKERVPRRGPDGHPSLPTTLM